MKVSILSILLAIAFIFIIWQNACNKGTKQVPQTRYDSLANAYHIDALKHADIEKADSEAIENAMTHAVQNYEQWQLSESKLNASQTTINRLSDKLAAAKNEKPDSSWVQVSPRYVDACDSIRLLNISQQQKITDYEHDGAEMVAAMTAESAAKDSALEHQKEFNRRFKAQLNDCLGQLKASDKTSKPRTTGYAEFGLLGNRINPLAGGEAGFTLIGKKGQMYGVKGQVVGDTWYAGVKTGFKISFK